MKKWLLILFFLSYSTLVQAMITKVIPLHYLDAKEVISLIQPLLSEGERVSGSGQTLVVKLNKTTLTQVRALLHQLDVPPVVFEITVFQGNPEFLEQKTTRIYQTVSRDNNQRSQSVNVMNGESAFVSTNTEVPVITAVGEWIGVNYEQRLIQNGLALEPVLQGEKVKLKIERIREASQNANQSIDSQKTITTLMVPLNQWVNISNPEGAVSPEEDQVRIYRAGHQFSAHSALYIKVKIIKKQASGVLKQ